MEETSADEAKWIHILEKEFDKECRSMQVKLKCETKKEFLPFENGLSAITGLFTQLALKTKTVLQENNRLKATLEGTKGKLTRALTYCGRLQKELQARRLEVRSLEVQLSKEPDKEKDLCALRTKLELELERYSQGEAREEQLNAELSTVRCLNVSLLECVSSLHSGLAEATLIAKCTESELTGRVQQLQLLLNGVRGAELQKMWTQIMAEITVYRQKAVLMAYCSRPKSILCDPYKFLGEAHTMRVSELKQVLLGCSPNTAAGDTLVLGKRRMVRNVTLTRRADEQLGISIVGGSELGVPILIAGLEEDKVAYTCGDLQIGDAILSINGESLQGRTHEDVVAMVGREATVVLEVMFAVGILELVSRREIKNSVPEETAGPHSTSDTEVPTMDTEQPGHQTAASQMDAQVMAAEQPGHHTASVPKPPAESIGSPSEETCVYEDDVQVVDSRSDQSSTMPSVEDNTQRLSSAFGLEHSDSGFIPKDLDQVTLESTLFYYDQDTALSMPAAQHVSSRSAATPASLRATPVTVSPVVAAPAREIVSRKGSETKLQLCDDKAQFPPDSLQSPPLCPNTPLYQTTILSIQSLNSTDDSDVPLFSLTL